MSNYPDERYASIIFVITDAILLFTDFRHSHFALCVCDDYAMILLSKECGVYLRFFCFFFHENFFI